MRDLADEAHIEQFMRALGRVAQIEKLFGSEWS